jgi:hypothetical protein
MIQTVRCTTETLNGDASRTVFRPLDYHLGQRPFTSQEPGKHWHRRPLSRGDSAVNVFCGSSSISQSGSLPTIRQPGQNRPTAHFRPCDVIPAFLPFKERRPGETPGEGKDVEGAKPSRRTTFIEAWQSINRTPL